MPKYNNGIGDTGILQLAECLGFNIDLTAREQREKEFNLVQETYPKLVDLLFRNESDKIKEIQCDNVINRTLYCEGAEEIIDGNIKDYIFNHHCYNYINAPKEKVDDLKRRCNL